MEINKVKNKRAMVWKLALMLWMKAAGWMRSRKRCGSPMNTSLAQQRLQMMRRAG